MASHQGQNYPKTGITVHSLISEKLQKVRLMKFLPDVGIHTKPKTNFEIICLVCHRPKSLKPDFGYATSKHTNFMKFCRIIKIDIKNWSWKFKIDISKVGYLRNNLWNATKRGLQRSIKWKLGHMISPNLLGDVMSSISRHWPSFKSFWSVELKSSFYKDHTRGRIFQDFSKIWSALYSFSSKWLV